MREQAIAMGDGWKRAVKAALDSRQEKCPHGDAHKKCAAAWKIVAAHDMELRVRHGTEPR